jgi:acetate kinase
MSDAILVINAGSSSIKFSVFAADDDTLRLLLDGQIEELSSAPVFTVTGADGALGWRTPRGRAGSNWRTAKR